MFAPGGPTFVELCRQALSSTDRGYDLLAEKFELTPFRTPDEVIEPAIAALGGPGSIDAALDLCCGTGAATAALRTRCRRLVVGVDRSQGMLEVARRRLSSGQGAPFALVRGDALAPPFSGRFDAVVSFGAFGHILVEDEPRFLRAIHDALVPGGRFVFATSEAPSPLSKGFWLAHGFNAVMRVRNALIRPPFIMYYLTFLLPEIADKLRDAGFVVDIAPGAFAAPYDRLRLVVATRPR